MCLKSESVYRCRHTGTVRTALLERAFSHPHRFHTVFDFFSDTRWPLFHLEHPTHFGSPISLVSGTVKSRQPEIFHGFPRNRDTDENFPLRYFSTPVSWRVFTTIPNLRRRCLVDGLCVHFAPAVERWTSAYGTAFIYLCRDKANGPVIFSTVNTFIHSYTGCGVGSRKRFWYMHRSVLNVSAIIKFKLVISVY